jgi:hypothetical protein
MKRSPTFLLLAVCGGRLPAQDAGLTLSELLRRARAVVTARCVQVTEAGAQRTASFARLEQLLGEDTGERIVLSESAERRCGSTLHAVVPGGSFLLFLDGQSPPQLLGGARGIEPLAPGLVAHVQELIAAADDAARVRVLAHALRADAARVQRDAARSLKQEPRLELCADGGVRAWIAATLLADPGLAQPRSLDLLAAAARLREPAALAVGAGVFVGTTRTELDRMVRFCLASFDAEDVARHVAGLAPAGVQGRTRQVELLADLASPTAAQALRAIAQANAGAAREAALLALVTRGDALPAEVAPAELQTIHARAQARQQAAPVYRNVRPQNAR